MQSVTHNSPEKLRRRTMGRYRYVRLRWRVLFSLIDMVGTVAFAVCHVMARTFSHAGRQQPRQMRRILIVQLDHLGDAIITTVMLPLLRRRYPKAAIEILCGPWNRELFQAIAEVDRVHVSHLNRFLRGDVTIFKRFAWAGAVLLQGLRLRRRRFDLGIDTRGEFPQALMLWLAGVGRRLGWGCGGGGFLLTDVAPFAHGRSEVESRLALLAELGIAPAGKEDLRPRFKPTAAARESLQSRERLECIRERPTWVAVHVSAGTTAKRWPVEHWRKLIAMLRDSGAGVVLVGGPGDRAISDRILGTDWPSGVVDFTGRLGVVELAALLERVDLFVGGDSGPAHLAAAVATPLVALFSGTNNHRQWQPYGPNVTVLRHPVPCGPCHREQCPLAGHPCMTGIKPAEVARAVQCSMLNIQFPMPRCS